MDQQQSQQHLSQVRQNCLRHIRRALDPIPVRGEPDLAFYIDSGNAMNVLIEAVNAAERVPALEVEVADLKAKLAATAGPEPKS